MDSELHLDRLPRTVELVRGEAAIHGVPDGTPLAVLLDQTRLPSEESYLITPDWREVVDAIKRLAVRGAPAIGIAGAAAVALRAAEFVRAQGAGPRDDAADFERTFVIDDAAFDAELYAESLKVSADIIASARPTAVNLAWAVERALGAARDALGAGGGPQEVADALFSFVKQLEAEDEAANRAIGAHGAALLPHGARVLTHCNAGSLATAFFGTALGVVYAAAEQGKVVRVYADETRPVGQGARLTAWELARAGVPVTLICDNMAASIMAAGKVDAVVVGADRIAANGDVANKIGTYGVAVLAAHHGIPFYVAAPTSTLDLSLATGAQIPIEQRTASEVIAQPIEGVDVLNPAFDVTPARLVTKIITERGAFSPDELKAAHDDLKTASGEPRAAREGA